MIIRQSFLLYGIIQLYIRTHDGALMVQACTHNTANTQMTTSSDTLAWCQVNHPIHIHEILNFCDY